MIFKSIPNPFAVRASLFALGLLAFGPNVLGDALPEHGSTHTLDSAVPIPPAEQGLETRTARQITLVPDITKDLEGPVFDDSGRMIFSDTQGHRLLRWTPGQGISTLVRFGNLMPGGLAMDNDRIYVAATTSANAGQIVSLRSDGSDLQTVVPESAGYLPNDLVFDNESGFYFTDARSAAGEPRGGVYYKAPGADNVAPVLEPLSIANGLALTSKGNRLWVGEFGTNQLHRLDLADATSIAPFGATVAYYFIGPAPDSMRVDDSGHVYVAMYGQGRILVFSRDGLPIGQILLPGRDESRFLNVTSMAIKPGTQSLFIVATDGNRPPEEAAIFQARAFGGPITGR